MNGLQGVCIATIILCAVMVPLDALGAGYQNSGQSATANAMGFTGVANPNEPNSSFFNPAAMSLSEGLKLYVGDTLILPSSTFEPAAGGETIETEEQNFPPPHLHLSYNNIADTGVSAGIGVTYPFGLGIEWPREWQGRTTIVSQDLEVTNINPNVSYKVPGIDLSVAVGAQLMLSTVELERSIQLDEDRFVEAQVGGSGSGIGGVLAAMYQPLEELTIGLQYRSRVEIDYDDSDIHFEGEEDTPFFTTFRDNPASTEITVPDLISLGAGYQLDKLFVTAQADYTLWSTYDEVVLDIDTGDDEEAIDEIAIVNDWEDAIAFRFGAQYDVTEKIPVRLGFAYDHTPIPDETFNASLPGNDRLVGTAGAGYKWESFHIDASYSYVHALSRDIENERTPPGTYQTTANLFALSLGYGYQ